MGKTPDGYGREIKDVLDERLPRIGRRIAARLELQRKKFDDIFDDIKRKDRELADSFDSRDRNLPGRHPADVPGESYTPGGNGWQHRNRGPHQDWMDYEGQIAGTHRTPDGRSPEWMQTNPDTGRPVAFDGHTTRGKPPVEVFLEAKRGYVELYTNPTSPRAEAMAESITNQARRQLDALPDGAVLEWHVSSPQGAAAIQALFEEAGIFDIVVHFTRKA